MNKTYSSTMFTAFLFFIFRFRLIHHSLNLFLILLNLSRDNLSLSLADSNACKNKEVKSNSAESEIFGRPFGFPDFPF